MIPLARLVKLPERQRLRKTALILQAAELSYRDGREVDAGYLAALVSYVAGMPCLDDSVRADLAVLAFADSLAGMRSCNIARHHLLRFLGSGPADWDFLEPETGSLDAAKRIVLPGVRAYLDDIRSPFNVGSIFRSAEAFGVEELILSPFTASPEHPRATRSAMGSVGALSWRRAGTDELAGRENVFVLETGGTPIGDFVFPSDGIVVLGSEELGAGPEAVKAARYGRVSIPQYGAKASLNVGVAFGVLMYAWTAFLREKGRSADSS
jgi:RNA methyltransferase, TrmH family